MHFDRRASREEQEAEVTSNAWAFRLWLNSHRPGDHQFLGWDGVELCRAANPAWFYRQVAAFARLESGSQFLTRHGGAREALVLLPGDGSRRGFSRDDLLADRGSADLPPMLRRRWPSSVLARGLSETLLRYDIRPDDRVLVARRFCWPGLTALLEGATVVLFGGTPDQSDRAATKERANVILGF